MQHKHRQGLMQQHSCQGAAVPDTCCRTNQLQVVIRRTWNSAARCPRLASSRNPTAAMALRMHADVLSCVSIRQGTANQSHHQLPGKLQCFLPRPSTPQSAPASSILSCCRSITPLPCPRQQALVRAALQAHPRPGHHLHPRLHLLYGLQHDRCCCGPTV